MNSNRGNPDDPTRNFRDRDFARGGSNGDNEATQFIPRADDAGYNPDSDFADGSGAANARSSAADNETRFETRYDVNADRGGYAEPIRQNAATPSGQYWAPLSEEERGYGSNYDQRYNPADGQYTQQYQQPQYASGAQPDSNGSWDDQRGNDSKGAGSTLKTIAITAVVAIVALVAIVIFFFVSSSGDNSDSATSTPSSSETASSSTKQPTSTPSTSSPTSQAPTDANEAPSINDARQRLEEEMNRLRETPPALPGLGDVTSGYGSVPADLVGKSPLTVEAELRINGFQNITVYDANGNVTNSAVSAIGKVASVDPAPGSEVATSTPVNIYLQ